MEVIDGRHHGEVCMGRRWEHGSSQGQGIPCPSFLALVLSKLSLTLQLHEILQQAGNSTFFRLYPGEKIQKPSAYLGKNSIAFGKINHNKA